MSIPADLDRLRSADYLIIAVSDSRIISSLVTSGYLIQWRYGSFLYRTETDAFGRVHLYPVE